MTARKRFFRVADSVLREPWDNDVLACAVRLMAYLNTRWARDQLDNEAAGSATVSIVDLMAITGKRRADVARKLAERLADVVSISIEHRGEVSLISWAKFPSFQKFDSRNGPETAPKSPAPISDLQSPYREEEEDPLTPVAEPTGDRPPKVDLEPVGDPAEPTPIETARRDAVAEAWPDVSAAFAAYGRRPTVLNGSRHRSMAAALREFPGRPSVLVDLVHGYVASKEHAGPGFDVLGYLTPETVFRASHRAKYLEAFDRAVARGLAPPFALAPGSGAPARAGAPSRIPPRSAWGPAATAQADREF